MPPKVAFQGYKTVFSKTLDEVIFSKGYSLDAENKLVKLLNKFINKKLTSEKQLGKGYSNTVYKIDDKYVLRFPSYKKPEARYFMGGGEREFSDIKLYYGESVAEFNSGLQILKNISSKKQIPAGVPMRILEECSDDEIEEFCLEHYLKEYSKLPQKAFNGVAKACKQLNKKGEDGGFYIFDFMNPNNFVLCGKTIKIVDDIRPGSYQNTNDIYHLLDAFINKYSLYTYAQYRENSAPLRKEIFKKLMLASERYELFDYNPLLPIDESLELSGIKEAPKVFSDALKMLKMNYGQNLKTHLKMVKEYLDTL